MKPLIFSIFFVLLSVSSCQNEALWYPNADVTISDYYEFTDTTSTKYLHITCVIQNTIKTSINSGAITFRFNTDKHDYLQTMPITVKIIPNGKIAANVSIAYISNNEQ